MAKRYCRARRKKSSKSSPTRKVSSNSPALSKHGRRTSSVDVVTKQPSLSSNEAGSGNIPFSAITSSFCFKPIEVSQVAPVAYDRNSASAQTTSASVFRASFSSRSRRQGFHMSSESMKAIHSLRAAKIPRFRAAAGPPFRWQRQVTRSPKDLAHFHGTVFRAIVNNDAPRAGQQLCASTLLRQSARKASALYAGITTLTREGASVYFISTGFK